MVIGTLLDLRPDVLEKVQEEVARIWSLESDSPILAEMMLSKMKYTHVVLREVVRYRAPGTKTDLPSRSDDDDGSAIASKEMGLSQWG